MITTEQFLQLQTKLNRLTEQRHRLLGQNMAHMKRLQDELGCQSLEEAKEKLSVLQHEIDKMERICTSKIKAFA